MNVFVARIAPTALYIYTNAIYSITRCNSAMKTTSLPTDQSSGTAPYNPAAMEVLRQFRLIFGSVRQHFREIEAQCGASGAQIWVLMEIRRTPGIGVTELSTLLGTHQSTCSLMVEKLVAKDLLTKERCKDDQRRICLFVTQAGDNLLAKAPGPAEGLLPKALNALPNVVLNTLKINIDELITQLGHCDSEYADTPLADISRDTPEKR